MDVVSVVKDQFRKIAGEERVEAQPPFAQLSSNSSSKNVSSSYHKHMTPFVDQKEGEGIFVKPKATVRMRIKSAEVPWT